MREDEASKEGFKKAVLAAREAFRAGNKEGYVKARAKVMELLNAKLLAKRAALKAETANVAKTIRRENMSKLNDILTELNNIPLKLIIKVSMKWVIGLLPLAIFLLFLISLFFDLFHSLPLPRQRR